MFNELKADAGPAHGLKGLGDYRSLYVNINDHVKRKSAGRQGPVQVVTAAIKAGISELQCKTYEEHKSLVEAAAESVGCTTYALPMVLGYFGTVPKCQEGGLIRG